MAGGQKGWSVVGEAGLAFFLLGLISGCTVRGWVDGNSGSDSPAAFQQFDDECAKADVAKRSGEDDYNAVILADSECIEYLMYQEAQEQQDRAEELEEVQSP